ncbi:MAG: RdgB/HAM1 family non-canonical purine NTP pyrophosphatase [Lentisphaeria bacterium]|nr:RdgB/HAM1 family non-canonical purine NTP pyrophosphatase [Lentisphaeria bacterium]
MSFIVVATANKHKVDEYKKLLGDIEVELKSLADFPDMPEIEENGSSFKENAGIKALAASKFTGAPAFADDSGLEVDALDGKPGIYSSRYAPTDPERIAKLLSELDGCENRRARFVCAIAIAFNGEVLETFEGSVEGTITLAPRGEGGFGYDPVFQPDGYDKTFGELPQEVKNKISHRARAFANAVDFVENELAAIGDVF